MTDVETDRQKKSLIGAKLPLCPKMKTLDLALSNANMPAFIDVFQFPKGLNWIQEGGRGQGVSIFQKIGIKKCLNYPRVYGLIGGFNKS